MKTVAIYDYKIIRFYKPTDPNSKKREALAFEGRFAVTCPDDAPYLDIATVTKHAEAAVAEFEKSGEAKAPEGCEPMTGYLLKSITQASSGNVFLE